MSGEMITFAANGHTCKGYLSLPAKGNGPGVIVIQEWWGLVDHIKDIADRFAAEGFVALAPDLYHGESTKVPDQAGKLMMALNIEATEKDLRGAVSYLLAHPRTTGTQVGTVGFCLGGQLSLFAACKNPQVGACVDYYGIHPKVDPPLENLQAPLLGFFADRDEFVGPDVVKALGSKLDAVGKSYEFHIFEEADHAFFNNTRPEVFHADYAAQSWKRMLAFYREHLAG